MDEKTRKEIESGRPVAIIYFDKDGNVTEEVNYNMENLTFSESQLEPLTRTLLDACIEFYKDPENVKKYEEWKAKQEKESLFKNE